MRSAAILALGAAGLVGCGSGNANRTPPARYQLEGSLTVVMDLGWDTCTLDTTAPDEIAVRFERDKSTALEVITDTPLKIVWAQAGQVLNTPATIDLAELRPDDPTRQRTTVTRNVRDDKRTVFPKLVRGTMSFFDQIQPDSAVRGEFRMTFENGIDFANGRTVFGPFTAKVPP